MLELGEKLLTTDPPRAKAVLQKCRLVSAIRLTTLFVGSIAEPYADKLKEWRPQIPRTRLLARHEGRDASSVHAFIDAATGHANTIIETENGRSICGAWRLNGCWGPRRKGGSSSRSMPTSTTQP